MPDTKAWKAAQRFQIIVGISLVLLAAFTVLQSFSDRASDKKQRECVEDYLTDTINSLNERTSYTSDVTRADRAQNESFVKIVAASLENPPLSVPEQKRLIRDYQLKLSAYLDLQKKAETARVENPYPTRSEFRECVS